MQSAKLTLHFELLILHCFSGKARQKDDLQVRRPAMITT